MKRNSRIAFLFSLLSCLTAALPGIAKAQSSDKVSRQIEVRISPRTKVVIVGEALEVRVEVWNVGSEQLFIEKTVHNLCGYSPLSLRLDLGPPLKPGPGEGCASDCADDPRASFTGRVVGRWMPLPVGHFYGTIVHMDADSFPQLQTPGRWRLRGEYTSNGDVSSSVCFFKVSLDPEQIAKLPYKAWQGKEDTNAVWIDVVRPGRSGKEKR
jgi:hypothetical protein